MSPEPNPTIDCRPEPYKALSNVSSGSADLLLQAMGKLLAVGGARIEWSFTAEPDGSGEGRLRMKSIEWTESSQALLGFGAHETLTARKAIRRVCFKQRRQLIATLRRSARSLSGFRQTVKLAGGSSDRAWIEITSDVEENPTGGRTMSVVFQNVSSQQLREAELSRELRRRDQMARIAGIGTWNVELATNELTWSDEVFHIHELDPGPTPSVAEAVAFYEPASAALLEDRLGCLIRDQKPYDMILPIITAKGNRRLVHTLAEAETGPDGTPIRLIGSFRDVTEEREAEAKLRASEERYALALEGAQDGLWDWEIPSNEIHYSRGWKQIIGYDDDEVANDAEEWTSRVPDEHKARAEAAMTACLSGETPSYRCEYMMRHKNGTWRWILARGQVVERDDHGQPKRMVGTHTDITEQVELREELVAAKETAEEAARVKSDFLATMSHEIRTPLNGILGLTQILVDSDPDEEQAEYLDVIYQSGAALLQILNDILDLSRTEAGMVELESVPFNPSECAQSTLALLHHAAASKDDLYLEIRIEDDVPKEILGDPGRLRQVLLNLVGNAVKFTDSGSVQVAVSTLHQDNGNKRLLILVSDTGIGIPREQAARLFDAFTQADSTTTRKFGGTGLGLSISRKLIHLMGGVIGCRPNLDGGSVFWIELPMHLPSTEDVTSPSATSSAGRKQIASSGEASPDPPLVLVVEDNPVNQLVARRMLERLGCTVVTVANGQEAVDASAHKTFDVLFMDCQMPVMDGYAATRAIRERESRLGVAPVPIVAMTANALQSDQAKCLAAGMNAYLTKPVLTDDLAAALQRALTAHRAA
ncbi:MAG: PAS domain S-box-containing protein [Planctomycetota bacterium]|jgi:PAS domain S-box-containing protein